MKQEELNKILNDHKLWMNGSFGEGKRAYLRGADLQGADLRGAYLRGADLQGADLRGADLQGADLRGADLQGADLQGAYLRGADLQRADLQGADLQGADLRGADLRGADLRGADLQRAYLQGADLQGADLRGAYGLGQNCPEEGSFVGFKKCRDNRLVKLEILADAKRSSATGRKCRCDKAKVLSITSLDGLQEFSISASKHDSSFIYQIGEAVSVDNFDDDRWNECAAGIHFFITKQEAIEY